MEVLSDNSSNLISLIPSIIIGICLSASCGYRIFAPFFILSLLSFLGSFELNDDLSWISSFPVLICLGIATFCEILAYYIPWFDNFLGMISTPVASIAGVIISLVVMSDLDPFLQWSLALIAGGGIATSTHISLESMRATSSVSTGGLGNFFIATFESFSAIILSILSILLPIVALIIVICTVFFFRKQVLNFSFKKT
tara:strand:+ start:2421 stop:3014 length:594 start_codon:yes stop_codon:yes gene_type:complete